MEEQRSGMAVGPKTVTSVAISAYLAERETLEALPVAMDKAFIDKLIAHLKIFVFAGHDTTAISLAYAYYLLDKNPKALATIRAEHNAVLGTDPRAARAAIAANPGLLNQLPYTAAVVKETLRLWAPASSIKIGPPGFFLTNPETKRQYPAAGFMLWSLSFIEHRLEQFWPQASEFLPERWLALEGHPLHVRKNAFRPFELGPRNCIGQELAHVELRAILAMTIREFDIKSAYPEDTPEVFGDKAYMAQDAYRLLAHPKNCMPVTVTRRDINICLTENVCS